MPRQVLITDSLKIYTNALEPMLRAHFLYTNIVYIVKKC